MAKLIKLITYAYLYEECDMPKSLPNDEVDAFVYRAQENLRATIGDEFYQDFKTNFEANTLSTAYTSLLPYVKQFLSWQTNELWTIRANFKSTRSGFRVHTEENSVVASEKEMAPIIRDAHYRSDYYRNLMVDFLELHSTDYPLFNRCNTKSLGGFKMTVVKKRDARPDIYNRPGGSYKCCG